MRFPGWMSCVFVVVVIGNVTNSQGKVDDAPESPGNSLSAEQSKPASPANSDEVTKFLKLNRDVQVLKAENLLANDPENLDAQKLLETAKKLSLEPIPLSLSEVGKFGYWPEDKVETLRSGIGSRLATLHPDGDYVEALVDWSVPEVPGHRLLVVTRYKTIRGVRSMTLNKVVQGVVTKQTRNDIEEYDVPVVEALNVKKATRALEKELAKLKQMKAPAE